MNVNKAALQEAEQKYALNDDFFKKHLSSYIKYHKRMDKNFALLIIQLTNVEMLRFTQGDDFANKLLQLFSFRLTQFAGSHDFISQISEENFVVMLKDISDYYAAKSLASKIIKYFGHKVEIDGSSVKIECRIGISCFPDSGDEAEIMIEHAQKARDQSPGGALFYNMNLEFVNAARALLEERFIIAFKKNELYLDYQPIVHMMTNQIIGFEALLRWHDDENGLVPTSDFIPLIRSNGLCEKINEYVIKKAFEDFDEILYHDDYPLKISFNIFRQDERLVDHLKYLLNLMNQEKQMAPHVKLEVEICEKDLMPNDSSFDTEYLMQQLKKLNISIAIDDFGNKNLNVDNIIKYPIDVIKVDAKHTRRIDDEHNPTNEIIIDIINNARNLCLDVIIKGVETKEQAAFLKSIGCPKAQGFYFHPPMSAADAIQLLKSVF